MNQIQKLIYALRGFINYLLTNMKRAPASVPPDAPHLGLLIPLAKAIQTFEGFYPGSSSYRNNNPGNMRYSQYCVSLGATGKSEKNFAIYPSYQVGFRALCQFIKDIAYNQIKAFPHDCTLQQMMNVYAPVGDGNHPQKYASFLAKSLGCGVDTPLKQII